MAKVNASPKKKVQAKMNTTGQLMAPPADPSVNAPRKFSGFTGKTASRVIKIHVTIKPFAGRKKKKELPNSRTLLICQCNVI